MANEDGDLLSFQDPPSAEAAAEWLRGQGVPARVEVRAALPGLVEGVRVVVSRSLEHRARWLLRSAGVSEGELNYLATGELDPQAGEER